MSLKINNKFKLNLRVKKIKIECTQKNKMMVNFLKMNLLLEYQKRNLQKK